MLFTWSKTKNGRIIESDILTAKSCFFVSFASIHSFTLHNEKHIQNQTRFTHSDDVVVGIVFFLVAGDDGWWWYSSSRFLTVVVAEVVMVMVVQ